MVISTSSRRDGHACTGFQIVGDEPAQRQIAERLVFHAIFGHGLPFTANDPIDRGREFINRQGLLIDIAADEVERRVAIPPVGGCRGPELITLVKSKAMMTPLHFQWSAAVNSVRISRKSLGQELRSDMNSIVFNEYGITCGPRDANGPA